ncbi:hypothetical protein [Streptomyces sp. NPDC093261]|uniref:hypothetical protein n=1 Tax=Streptomyces sp. NPDC093261 TaxID=3366037 RepID=UPI003811ED8A
MAGEDDRKPENALDEVFHEISEAAERDPAQQRRKDDRHEGEAADAITPNAVAQKESQGD